MPAPTDLSQTELQRLSALRDYQILDTAPEAVFDDIVRTAAEICGTPMALISLVDEHRQWFKAALGLEARETAREIAFCDHAIQDAAGIMQVRDATQDVRFRGNPLVTGRPDLRFYAGAPLRTPDGHAIGTLCVLDTKPGELTESQLTALTGLSRQVITQFELRRELALRRAAEGHRKEAEYQLRRAQEAGGIGMFTANLLTGLVTGSPQFWRLFGLPPNEGMSRAQIADIVVREDQLVMGSLDAADALRVPLDVEYRVRLPDTGEVRWLSRRAEFELDPQGQPIRMFGIVRDITDERIARGLLQERETQALALAAERTFVVELIARQRQVQDPEQVMLISAEALGRRLGVSRVNFYRLAGRHLLVYARGWSDGSLHELHGEMAAGAFGPRVERARRTGETLTFSDSRHDRGGHLEPFVAQGVLAGICLSILDKDRWQGGLSVHHAFVRAWSAGEVALAKEVAELTWLAVERSEAIIRYEHRIGQQDETIGQVAGELRSEAEARSSAEGQLRQMMKMEAVGQLTGGIAHDFNNMLAVIIGSLNLAERRLARGEANVAKYLEAALDGAGRAAALTQRLLAFARQQPLLPEALDANRLISGLSELLRRTLGEQVTLETVQGAGLWKINADPNQLENVIINLATNARDAMPDGGKLTIETNNAHVDRDYAQQLDLRDGQYVQISVSDTGSGMSPEVVSKAFDPFFTTKGVGQGTGLGLSQVFGFIRQSGGHVRVYSEVGHGTTMKIYLPRFTGESTPKVRLKSEGPVRRGSSHEVVLVVEDEPRVLALSVESLRDLGYTVVHASSAAAALTLLEGGQDIALLFTDVVMPDMTGRQLADRVLAMHPQAKVLFTTGYTRNAVVHSGVVDPGTHFLPKPFSVDQLGRMVRRVLDEVR